MYFDDDLNCLWLITSGAVLSVLRTARGKIEKKKPVGWRRLMETERSAVSGDAAVLQMGFKREDRDKDGR